MSSGAAIRRLKKEYTLLAKERPPGVLIVRPLETNFLHAHFLLGGEAFYDTPYEGGVYHGVLQFPSNYPMKPPSVIMRMPSGRFVPDKKICFSMSDFHPEQWNPMWNISTILTGLVSFMNSEEITTGGMSATAFIRRDFAKKSLQSCMEQDALAKTLFESILKDIALQRSNLGNAWPPERLPPTKPQKPVATAVDKKMTRRKTQSKPNSCKEDSKEIETEETESSEVITTAAPGKNAAKNRKKREKEKRKKLARMFFTNLREQTPAFLNAAIESLSELNIDVSDYPADHVCWRTESMDEYSELVNALRDDARLLIESKVGGRNIATFELLEPVPCGKGRTINVVEIPAPKDGRPYKGGLEHVEFVIGQGNENSGPMNEEARRLSLEKFMKKYPGVEWNIKAIDKRVNPDVSLQVELEDFGVCSVKFHLMSLSDVIEHKKEQNTSALAD